jgi:DHA3 family macrolide efflux protein-like MFS transporter
MGSNWKKNAALFLSSQTISLLGSSLVQYAIMWYITLKTGSGVMMTVYIICSHLPAFFISPFGGVWADRFNRKHLAAIADSGIAIATLALAVVFMLGYREIWLLFVISAVRALGGGVHSPCVSAMLPQLVPEDKLMRVNGMKSSLQSVMLLASPALSGVLIAFAPLEYIFFIDVITAAIGVSVLLSIRMPAQQRKEAKAGGYFADLRLGFQYIGGHRFIRAFILFFAVFQFLVVPVALLTPLQVVRSFGGDVWYLTAIEITFSAGMLLGGLAMTVWGGFRNRTHSMIFAGIVLGLLTLALGFVPWFAVYLVIMVLMGLLIPLFNVPTTVLLQEKVEPNFMGRVFGVMEMIASLTMPLGILVFGPLADTVRIEWLLVGTGVLMAIESLLLRHRTMIEAGKPKSIAEKG